MFGFEYPEYMPIGRVGLEVSLKPFGLDLSEAGIEKTCRELFDGWRELIGHAQNVSVLMWTSDGSEILEYDGNLESAFDWSRYIGIGNPKKELPKGDPNGDEIHHRPYLYMDNPPVMRYADLKRIIAALKRVGREMLKLNVEVGETFDPGPEFAYSDFKFHRHPEMNRGSMMDNLWIHCAARLHADHNRYAAYPNGIPEGTHFGRFLGEQFMALRRDVGFDYIWLSNGFGFSLQSWNWKGELFDGERFDDANASAIRENIRTFWREFTAVMGDTRIETRGSNLTAGMDISAHGCPIDDIYRVRTLVAPPNSPWAAIDYRFGLELAGFMSRMAHLPEKGYLFRYYTHDPWWHNSPWFDRYDRTPHDIYLPLTVARLDENGRVTPPEGINFLSADDSYGQLPRRCPVEVTPFLLDAYSHYPDAPGLITWLYPFESYVRLGLYEGKMQDMFMDDWLIENAIDQGLPLNSVIADDLFVKSDMTRWAGKILVTPVPHANTPAEQALFMALDAGCRVVLYGGAAWASDEVRALIGVAEDRPIEGELTIDTALVKDAARGFTLPKKLRHVSLLSGGGIGEIAVQGAAVLATVQDGAGNARIYATLNEHARAGRLAWMRGSFPHDQHSQSALPQQLDRREYFPVAAMLRGLLETMDVVIRFTGEQEIPDWPVMHVSMCGNMYYVTSYAKDTTAKLSLRFPEGAPLLEGNQCVYENGLTTYHADKFRHKRLTIFADQKERAVLSCERKTAENPSLDERFLIRGLKDATLTLRLPLDARVRVVEQSACKTGEGAPWMNVPGNVPFETLPDGTRRTLRPVTGDVFIAWQSDNNAGCMLGENQRHPEKFMETRR